MSLARKVQVGEKRRLEPVQQKVLSWLLPALKDASTEPLVGVLAQKTGSAH